MVLWSSFCQLAVVKKAESEQCSPGTAAQTRKAGPGRVGGLPVVTRHLETWDQGRLAAELMPRPGPGARPRGLDEVDTGKGGSPEQGPETWPLHFPTPT